MTYLLLDDIMTNDEIKKAFGKRVKELRKQRRWTQKDLAGRLGIRFALLNKYEGGLHVPPLDKLIELADALDTSVDFLLTGDPGQDVPLHSKRLLERFQELEEFDANAQQVVIELIDAMILKQKVGRIIQPTPTSSPATGTP